MLKMLKLQSAVLGVTASQAKEPPEPVGGWVKLY